MALWRAPGWMHATTAQDRYDARVLVISVGGAIVVGTGLLYTARGYRLSRCGQVTDRFTVALERLGSGELYVRIGGVHALEHVMRDSAEHHNDVIEVLTAFIRNRAPRRDRQVWPSGVDAPGDRFGSRSPHSASARYPGGPDRAGPPAAPPPAAANRPDWSPSGRRPTSTGANLTGANLGCRAPRRRQPHRCEARPTPGLTDATLHRANLIHVVWPSEKLVPRGWEPDADGRLKQSSTSRDGQGDRN